MALLLLASCKRYELALENRPCDASGACLAGYVCSVNLRCVREGTAAACQPRSEIACNGIDEDCNGVDLVETGTLDNCGGCNDACTGPFVTQSACVSLSCTVTRCELGHVNADGDAVNGCEKSCDNVDGDNLCDSEDTCIDKDDDGVGDGTAANAGCAIATSDSDDANPMICADTDSDLCNDCSSGTYAPASDGIDRNGNGICNVTDTDEDHDGVPIPGDSDDGDPNVCRDLDADGCNDCSQHTGTPSTTNDGPDFDADGLCNVGDPDDDDDTVLDTDDHNDASQTLCQDLDGDGCDDCKKFAIYGGPNIFDDGNIDVDRDGLCGVDAADLVDNALADCDDGIPTCAHDCSDSLSDGDTTFECIEDYCRQWSGVTAATGVCHVVTGPTGAQLIGAMTTYRGSPLPTFILINSDILMETPAPTGPTGPSGIKVVIHQRAGTRMNIAFSSDGELFHFSEGSDGNEFYGLSIQPVGGPAGPTSRLDTVFHFESNNNVVSDSRINGFASRGIFIHGATGISGNIVRNNIIGGGLAAENDSNVNASNITGDLALIRANNTRVEGNVFLGPRMSAMSILGSANVGIDHNTFLMTASTNGAALNFVDPGSTGSCARNNLFFNTDSTQRVIRYESNNSTAWASACTAGNLVTTVGGNVCDMTADGAGPDCSLLPSGLPAAVGVVALTGLVNTNDPSAQGFLCLKAPHIDAPAYTAVPLIDYNGPLFQQTPTFPYIHDTFNGATPEPGAREHFTPYCP